MPAPDLLAAFAGFFVIRFGWSIVLAPSPLALIGYGGFVYLISAALMIGASG